MLKTSIKNKNNWKYTAHIGQGSSWWLYYSHYKTALDELVNLVEENLPINTVSLPILFLVRHGMELGLKAQILKFEKVNTTLPKLEFKKDSHNLETLYSNLKSHIDKILTTIEIDESDKEKFLEDEKKLLLLINKLHTLDKGSYSFRYPVDTKQNFNFEWDEKLNIADIITSFYEIQTFILNIDVFFARYGVFLHIDDEII